MSDLDLTKYFLFANLIVNKFIPNDYEYAYI